MRFLDELAEEHRLVDRVSGSLIRFAEHALDSRTSAQDVADFVHFFRVYVGGFHHDREEKVLFPALVEHAEVPADRGPISVIAAEHRESTAMVDDLEAVASEPSEAAGVARRLAHHLWEHIDKEDSVLLPESEQRLIRGGLAELEGRPPTPDEEAALEIGERLIERFPPLDDPEVIRGDGCIACSAFAVSCGGIEKEWWNDWEHEYHRSLDEG
jgi:hemerythrin-like domain-containing protein